MFLRVGVRDTEKLYKTELCLPVSEFVKRTPGPIYIRPNVSLTDLIENPRLIHELWNRNINISKNVPVGELNAILLDNKFAPLLYVVDISDSIEIHVPYTVGGHCYIFSVYDDARRGVTNYMPTDSKILSPAIPKDRDVMWKGLYKSVQLNLSEKPGFANIIDYIENTFTIEQYIKNIYRTSGTSGYHLYINLLLDSVLKGQRNYEMVKKAFRPYRLKINLLVDAVMSGERIDGFYKRDIKSVDITNDYYSCKTVFDASRRIVSNLYYETQENI